MRFNQKYLNGFRYLYKGPTKEKPPHLVEYVRILDFQVYWSTYNSLLFVVYDHFNEDYYRFEFNKFESKQNIDSGIKANIKGHIL